MLKALTVATIAAISVATAASSATISGMGDPSDHASLTGGTVIGFDTLTSGDFSSVTTQGVTFKGVDAPLSISTDFNGNFNTSGGKHIQNGFDFTPGAFEFTFATVTSAFGFNFGASDAEWLLTAFDSADNVIDTLLIGRTRGSNDGDYFGIFGGGIKRATLSSQGGGDYIFIDDFTYVATVPIPASFPLILTGLGLLGFMKRRRRA